VSARARLVLVAAGDVVAFLIASAAVALPITLVGGS
jgi:hypothetical protein